MKKRFSFFSKIFTLFLVAFLFNINSAKASDINLVKNGDFEIGVENWNGPNVGDDIYKTVNAINGDYHAWVGYEGEDDFIYQQGIVIPANATSLELNFNYVFKYVNGNATVAFFDEGNNLSPLGGIVLDANDDTGNSVYSGHVTIPDIANWKGKTVTMVVDVDNSSNASNDSELYIDDITLSAIVPTVSPISVYRFANLQNGLRFWTIDEAEKNMVIAKYPTLWKYEGAVFKVYNVHLEGTIPVYRFANLQNGLRFWTTNTTERNMVIAKYPTLWKYEGIAYYVYPNQETGTIPVYRFANLQNGLRFWTIDEAEKSMVQTKYPTLWKYEGVTYYVVSN